MDTEAEKEQLQLIAQALEIEEGRDPGRAIADLIIQKDFQLTRILTHSDPKLHLPAGFIGTFLEHIEAGKGFVNPEVRTMQWFEFVESRPGLV